MDGMLKIGFVCVGIIIFLLYVGIIVDHIREKKLYKEKRNVYVRNKQFLFMENDGNLLSLTVQKKGFDVQMHYFVNSTMIIAESGDC